MKDRPHLLYKNSISKSLPTVRRHSPNTAPGMSIVALDGGASLCQREEKTFPLLTKGDEGGLDVLFQRAKMLRILNIKNP